MSRSRAGLAVVGVVAVLAALWFFGLRTPEVGVPGKGAASGSRRAGSGGAADEASGSAPRGAPGVAWDRDPEGPLRLEGQVVDQDGDPVAEALVTLRTMPPQTTRTQADGSFAFDKLISRTFYLNARAGNLVANATYKLTSTSDPVVLRARLGTTVAVQVQDESTQPIRGARIRTDRDDDPKEGDWLAQTDEAGRALVTGLEMGFAGLRVEAEGFAPGRSMVVIGEPNLDPKIASAEVTVVLHKGVAVSGRIVDEAGKPIPKARVRPIKVRSWIDPDGFSAITADEQGSFRFPVLSAGRYTFAAADGEHGRAESAPVEIADQPVRDVTITLPAGGVVAGAVVDKQGAEVPFAVVRVTIRANDQMKMYQLSRLARQVASDAHGRFEIKGLARDNLQVRAEGERAASAVAEVSLVEQLRRDDLRLTLDLDGAISGTVVDGAGEPVAEVEVRAFPDVATGGAVEPFAFTGDLATTSDGSGRFTLTGLTASAYRVSAGPGSNPFDADTSIVKVGVNDVRIVLAKPGRIVGRLVGSDGKPPTFASIHATGQLPVTTRSGEFIVSDVSPGTYEVTVRSREHTQKTVAGIKVEAGKDADAGTIELTGGRRVTGRVVDSQRRPVAGALVMAGQHMFGSDDDDDGMFREYAGGMQGPSSTRTDATGAFELRGLELGVPLQVTASHSTGKSEPVAIPPGTAEPAPLTLRLHSTGSVAGVVTVGGKPASGMMVSLIRKGERGAPLFTTTGEDGAYFIDRVGEGDYMGKATRRGSIGREPPKLLAVAGGKRTTLDFSLEGGAISLSTPVSALPDQRVDAAHILLFEGVVSLTTGEALKQRRGGSVGMDFWFPGNPPPSFKGLAPGPYSVCAQPLTGDLTNRATFKRIMEHGDTAEVICKPVTLAASPEEQTLPLALPSMKPPLPAAPAK